MPIMEQKYIDDIDKWPYMVIFLYNIYIFVYLNQNVCII